MRHHAKPFRGRVWFEGGPEYPAVILGTTNGHAVAVVKYKDAMGLLRSALEPGGRLEARSNEIAFYIASMDQTSYLPLVNGRVLFDGSWALWHEPSKVKTVKGLSVPSSWWKKVNLDPPNMRHLPADYRQSFHGRFN